MTTLEKKKQNKMLRLFIERSISHTPRRPHPLAVCVAITNTHRTQEHIQIHTRRQLKMNKNGSVRRVADNQGKHLEIAVHF